METLSCFSGLQARVLRVFLILNCLAVGLTISVFAAPEQEYPEMSAVMSGSLDALGFFETSKDSQRVYPRVYVAPSIVNLMNEAPDARPRLEQGLREVLLNLDPKLVSDLRGADVLIFTGGGQVEFRYDENHQRLLRAVIPVGPLLVDRVDLAVPVLVSLLQAAELDEALPDPSPISNPISSPILVPSPPVLTPPALPAPPILSSCAGTPLLPDSALGAKNPPWVPGHVIVKMDPASKAFSELKAKFGEMSGADLKRVRAQFKPKTSDFQWEQHYFFSTACGLVTPSIQKDSEPNSRAEYFILKVPGDTDIDAFTTELGVISGISAEPDYIRRTQSEPASVSTGGFENYNPKWDMSFIEADFMWANIPAPEQSQKVTVAMVDTDFYYPHAALLPMAWQNADEFAENQFDDDYDGYVDNLFGFNVISRNGSIQEGIRWEDSAGNGFIVSHGTAVGSLMVAKPLSSITMAGVAHNLPVNLMGVKATESHTFTSTDLVEAITYIQTMKGLGENIRFMHGSYAGPVSTHSSSERSAMANLGQAGVLIVTAAGNYGSAEMAYPGSYNLENIINVANVGQDRAFMESSSYGRCHVDLGAPGQHINVARQWAGDATSAATSGYHFYNDGGTSFASPHVTGVALGLATYYPQATWRQIKWAILKSASEFPHQVYNNADGTIDNSKTTLTGGIVNYRRAYEILGQNINVRDDQLGSLGWSDCRNGNVKEKGGGGATDWVLSLFLLGLIPLRKRLTLV